MRRRVLIVDDSEAFTEAVGLVVESLGHQVRTANDGWTAVAVADAFRPNVVLMDLGMPGMDGYEAARRLRERSWAGNLLLVAVTGWGQSDALERSRAAGFDRHIVKPARAAELRRLLGE